MIRLARESDFAAITTITNQVIATTATHFGYELLGDDELASQWRAHADRHPWFVADDAGVIGYAKAGVWRDRAAYAWTCETTVYLAETARGRGVGTTLYRALLDDLAARGFRSAVAGITLPNAPRTSRFTNGSGSRSWACFATRDSSSTRGTRSRGTSACSRSDHSRSRYV